jgi:hypothetical protein
VEIIHQEMLEEEQILVQVLDQLIMLEEAQNLVAQVEVPLLGLGQELLVEILLPVLPELDQAELQEMQPLELLELDHII